MFTIVVIIASILVALLVIGGLWKRVRPSANFNLIYTRALRVEGSREVAIAAALEHLRTFLAPFDQLSDNQIASVARVFSDVDEPHKALQPVLQQAERAKSLSPYMDERAPFSLFLARIVHLHCHFDGVFEAKAKEGH